MHSARNRIKFALLALLSTQLCLIAYLSFVTSPTNNEPSHLVSGVYVLETQQYDLYKVNPPLIRTIAALPVYLRKPATDWGHIPHDAYARAEWVAARQFMLLNNANMMQYIKFSRLVLLPFPLMCAGLCYVWSKELYSRTAGVAALLLCVVSPTIMSYGCLITPDMGAAFFGLYASWRFWKWLKLSSWRNAIHAGFALGLALLSKMTLVILLFLWPVMLPVWVIMNYNKQHKLMPSSCTRVRMLVCMLVSGLFILNLGYGFDGSFQKLGDYQFGSRVLSGPDSIADGGEGGNRFAGTLVGDLPVPVPREYLQGMDLQKIDFELMMLSYLDGQWRLGGWWYYYFVAIALKVPVGFLVIGFVALFLTFDSKQYRDRLKDEVILLLPAIAIFTLVSSQTGFSKYLRYILPCFPFAFIWMSKVAKSWELNQKKISVVVSIGLVWSIVSSLWVFPHSMSYFNELAGGPNGGHRYLLDANIDWGQDLFYFKDWYDEHSEARPIFTDFYTFIDNQHYGIDSLRRADKSTEWYAVSVNQLFGPDGKYKWLYQNYEPVAKAGYSIWIFHVPGGKPRELRADNP